jgi:hypothetical protein
MLEPVVPTLGVNRTGSWVREMGEPRNSIIRHPSQSQLLQRYGELIRKILPTPFLARNAVEA